MRNISEAELALSFHNAAGKPIDPGISLPLTVHFYEETPICCHVITGSKDRAVTGAEGREYFPLQ